MYGEIRVYRNDTQHFAVNCRVFQSQLDFEHHKAKVNKLLETNAVTPFSSNFKPKILGMVRLHQIYEEVENHLCSQFFKLYTVYDYYPHTLA